MRNEHNDFANLMKQLESDPATKDYFERARQDIQAYFAEMKSRQQFVRDQIHHALVEEFVEDWNIRDPGTLANNTADAILPTIMRLLSNPKLTSEIPMSTETKVEL